LRANSFDFHFYSSLFLILQDQALTLRGITLTVAERAPVPIIELRSEVAAILGAIGVIMRSLTGPLIGPSTGSKVTALVMPAAVIGPASAALGGPGDPGFLDAGDGGNYLSFYRRPGMVTA
jgi:hypothetical protein